MNMQFVKMHSNMVIKAASYYILCSVVDTKEATADWKPMRVLQTRKPSAEMDSMFLALAEKQGCNFVTEEEYFDAAYRDLDQGADCRFTLD